VRRDAGAEDLAEDVVGEGPGGRPQGVARDAERKIAEGVQDAGQCPLDRQVVVRDREYDPGHPGDDRLDGRGVIGWRLVARGCGDVGIGRRRGHLRLELRRVHEFVPRRSLEERLLVEVLRWELDDQVHEAVGLPYQRRDSGGGVDAEGHRVRAEHEQVVRPDEPLPSVDIRTDARQQDVMVLDLVVDLVGDPDAGQPGRGDQLVRDRLAHASADVLSPHLRSRAVWSGAAPLANIGPPRRWGQWISVAGPGAGRFAESLVQAHPAERRSSSPRCLLLVSRRCRRL